jgi:hypothetical protein
VLERKKNPCITIFKALSTNEHMLEIHRGLAIGRDEREVEEAKRLEEIILKEEVELKAIQDEKVRLQQEKESQRKEEEELRRK